MKFAVCPHCKKDAIHLWYLFIFPSPLWLSWACKTCKNKISFNWDFLIKWFASVGIGVFALTAIEFFTKPYVLGRFGAVYWLFVYIAPMLLGVPIFKRSKEKIHD